MLDKKHYLITGPIDSGKTQLVLKTLLNDNKIYSLRKIELFTDMSPSCYAEEYPYIDNVNRFVANWSEEKLDSFIKFTFLNKTIILIDYCGQFPIEKFDLVNMKSIFIIIGRDVPSAYNNEKNKKLFLINHLFRKLLVGSDLKTLVNSAFLWRVSKKFYIQPQMRIPLDQRKKLFNHIFYQKDLAEFVLRQGSEYYRARLLLKPLEIDE